MSVLEQKQRHFLSATKYAVVGAANDTTKFGFKDLKWLHDLGKDVVAVNIKPEKVLGHECYESLAQLPDPTHTSVVIVVPPKATLEVLKQAASLGVFAFWLQPGTEDDDVVKFIKANPALDDISLYDTPLHQSPSNSKGLLSPRVVRPPIRQDTGPPCSGLIPQGNKMLNMAGPLKVAPATPVKVDADAAPSEPDQVEDSIPSSPVSDTSTTPTLIADNVVAGVKRPVPSRTPTPQPRARKSLKTSDFDKTGHNIDLGDAMPGLA
ncbi:CoA-binding domain-containing protein [Mycena indigotica]|uniref:CoA-binding domain-containing protein n=1 Tax=Mycena indigotica TaxID=2126181 RepID=A0A8H6SGD5_9AGAR|nr:CoA-binding domain-containing protein [Mycena indigotica]KAF7299068.1 CoA-binding domain-containing protein [Mycena indigotica]